MPRASQRDRLRGRACGGHRTDCQVRRRDEALSYVAAYSVFNDVTARDLQLRTSQWISGKALDTFAPMGPGLVPADWSLTRRT